MTRKRSILFFWALFLVPTLIIAAIAFRLLSHEQERINRSALRTLSQRAKTISETIHFTIDAVQENLQQSLQEIDPRQLESVLFQWEQTNPLVRNVFIYTKDKGLDYPVRGMESTQEERQFISRYDALFSGRTPFDFNTALSRDDAKPATAAETTSDSRQPYSAPKVKTQSSRQKLIALSRVAQKEPVQELQGGLLEKNRQGFQGRSGWIPWFSENRLYILGWVQTDKTGPIYGVELELMTLLSRLVVDFPKSSNDRQAAIRLMDGTGNIIHQSGNLVTKTSQKPVVTVPVSNLLPHWQIAVYLNDKGFGANQGFLYISVLLLAIFIVAIVSGGFLLTRLTLQNMKDARQKTSFVSSVSHELKTPLTSIRMYAELLLTKRVTDEKKMDTYLSVIVAESGRLTRLINNVLDFGKLEQDKKKYHWSTFDMKDFLTRMILSHQIRIQHQGLEIVTQVEPGDFQVTTDTDAIEQVVLNLMDNVLKYAGEGKFIKFVLKREDAFILLAICDDGPGIPKAQQEMIFEKFYRGDNSLTSKQPGSGLGLSIARQMLRNIGGDLVFESTPENKSCFTARIKDHDAD